ncbi:MAG TPA: pitrilysin family protein [Catalimonadaceae bacterium]|nr:pitrilysin family protein [Catalimonadaceae bacterium]
MSKFTQFFLDNGLRVMVLPDQTNPMAVVNLMYNVGSRDERADKTGFAHLFEHLMFGGSVNIPSYDEPLQMVGGENNAFTNTDITNYYIQIPTENLETAFWLESDRMLSLAFGQKSLDVQKGVVIEEFKQRYLNQPYGNAMHHLRSMAYKVHPYQWPTIGKEISHIENATIEDVKDFFYSHYVPNNCILVVAGNVTESQIKTLAEKWFGPIPSGKVPTRNIPQEPPQTEKRREEITGRVPMSAIYKAYPMASRMSDEFYEANLLSDMLGHGKSSRLVDKLVKKDRIFHSLSAYVTGSMDPGLFIIEGKVNEEISIEKAEKALMAEIEILKKTGFEQDELEKVKNQSETALAGADVDLLHRAINLAYFTLLGDPDGFEKELEKVRAVNAEKVDAVFNRLITTEKENTLIYHAEKI